MDGTSTSAPPSRIAGRYEVLSELGRGGTARVYRVLDPVLGVERAVKVLEPTPPGQGTGRRTRLRAEARAMARFAHPNILRVHDVGDEGGHDFVVMELAPGGSLSEVVQRYGPLPEQVALRFTVQILAGLAAAHAAGIVHRDVKPQNVLLDANGVAMLADFGIALLEGDHERSTRTGIAMGTLAYMAPEQRVDARSVGATADLYAVGTTLYHLLTGATPMDLFTAGAGHPRWERIPAGLLPILLKATRYGPEQRYPTAAHMAADLLPLVPIDASTATPAPLPYLTARGPTLVPLPDPAANRTAIGELGARVDHGPTLVEPAGSRFRRAPIAAAIGLGLAALLVAGWYGARALQADPPAPAEGADAVPDPTGVASPAVATTPRVEAASGGEADAPELVSDPSTATEPLPAAGPAATVAPVPPPPATAGPVAGPWTGSIQGVQMELILRGGTTLTGTVRTRIDASVVEAALTGAFDPVTRAVTLVDDDPVDGGRYEATLAPDGATLEGRFWRSAGGMAMFRLRRPR